MFDQQKGDIIAGAVLWLLVLAAVAAALWAGLRFHAPAGEPHNVEFTVRYTDVELFASRAGMSTEETLAFLREQGVTSIGVSEYTLWRLRRDPGYHVLSNLELAGELAFNPKLAPYWDFIGEATAQEGLRLGDYVVLMPSGPWAEQVFEHLGRLREVEDPAVFRLSRVSREGMELFFILGARYDYLPYVTLGAHPGQLEKIAEAGLLVNPYLGGEKIETSTSVEQALSTYDGVSLSAVVFEGGKVSGFPDFTAETAAALAKRGLPAALYEYHQYPRGMTELAPLLDYNLAVMIPGKSGLPSGLEVWNGVRERNVQLVELQIRDFAPRFRGEELRDRLSRQMSSLQGLLREKGYLPGGLQTFTPPALPRQLYLLMGAGLAAFFLLLLRFFIPVRPAVLLLLLLLATALLLALFRWNNVLTGQLLALWTALLFPLYPLLRFLLPSPAGKEGAGSGNEGAMLERAELVRLRPVPLFTLEGKFLWRSALLLGGVFLFSLAGGFLLHGFLMLPPFFSGLEFFRGVKVMYVVPLVIAVLAVLACSAAPADGHGTPAFGAGKGGLRLLPSGEFGKPCAVFLRRLLRRPLVLGDLLLLGFLLLAAYMYLTRTGHVTNINTAESQVRGFLDLALGVRPRFKEFLLGYPPALLGLYLLSKPGGKPAIPACLLLAAGVLVPVSVLNTFAHIQAPVILSFWRSLHGFWLGGICGLLLLFFWMKGELLLELVRLYGRMKKEKKKTPEAM